VNNSRLGSTPDDWGNAMQTTCNSGVDHAIPPPVSASERARRAAQAALRNAAARGERSNGHVATSDKDYSRDEMEFLAAVEEYKNRKARRFLAYTEVFHIVRELGYGRLGLDDLIQ
jgi:hypothetical protein